MVKSGAEEKRKDLKEYITECFNVSEKLKKSIQIDPEDDFGDTEYKLKLVDSSISRLQHLMT